MALSTRTKGFDWVMLSLYLSLVAIGLLMQYATYYNPTSDAFLNASSTFTNQLMWAGISIVAFFVCLLIDRKIWNTFAYPIFGISLLLLVIVLLFGTEVKGATSWIKVAGYSFQPSEFAKLGTALGLSSFLASFKGDFKSNENIMVALVMIFAPAALIMLQPDAGSVVVFMSLFLLLYKKGLNPMLYFVSFLLIAVFILSLIYSPMLVVVITLTIITSVFFYRTTLELFGMIGALVLIVLSFFFYDQFYYLIFLVVLSIAMAVAYFVRERDTQFTTQLSMIMVASTALAFGTRYAFDHILQPHQQDRINVWLRPHLCDPRGSLYNIIQSKIAIGSGGFQGRGFLNGALTRYNYVPEQSTDFIFTVIGEEQGFIGAITVIIIFAALIIKILQVGERAQTPFISHYAYAVGGFFLIHYFINIGMTLGIMPVIGIPLPFLSKGGTSLLVFSMMLGILLSMDTARYKR